MSRNAAPRLAAAAMILAALGGLGWTLAAVQTPTSLATLTLMEGDVKIERGGKMLPAMEGQRLLDKDRIVTTKGRAEVIFADGTTIRTTEDTRVGIGQGSAQGRLLRSIELTLGNLWFKVTKMTQVADARTEFLTPTAIAAVRGTEGEIAVGADGHSQFALTTGALDVRNKDGVGRTERITAYQMVAVSRGKAPTMPVGYLPKPAPLIRHLAPGERGHGAGARGPAGARDAVRAAHGGGTGLAHAAREDGGLRRGSGDADTGARASGGQDERREGEVLRRRGRHR